MDNSKNAHAEKARKHTEDMAKRYAKRIHESSMKTEGFDGDTIPGIYNADLITDEKHEPQVVFERMDSVSALFKYRNGRTAVLDFASFTKPGGGFLEGSTAQEEALCHASTLYNVLQRKEGFYAANTMKGNRGLYSDRALYVPGVAFFGMNGKSCQASVITCAAPNWSVASREGVTETENCHALISRIRFVLNVAMAEGVETLVLGAFGCGVFGQSALAVGSIFAMLIGNDCGNFRRIVFAIPDEIHFNALKRGYEYSRKNLSIRIMPAGMGDVESVALLMRSCGSKGTEEELEETARKCMELNGFSFKGGICPAVYLIQRADTHDSIGLMQTYFGGAEKYGELYFISLKKSFRHQGIGSLAVQGLTQIHPEITQWECTFPENASCVKRLMYRSGFKFRRKDLLGGFVFGRDTSVCAQVSEGAAVRAQVSEGVA